MKLLTTELLRQVSEQAISSPRLRKNHNLHPSDDSRCHRLLNAIEPASYIRPHPPYRNPPGYHDLYDADDVPAFCGHAGREAEAAAHPLAALLLELPYLAAAADEAERRQLRATYHGMQAEVDAQLGRLFDYLARSGLADDTLVVLTSDHGEMGGDHHLLGKAGYFDESFRVPLVVADPRHESDETRGRIVGDFTESVDVMATVLDWLGAEVPLQVDGTSLLPWCHDPAPPANWRTAAHFEWDFRHPARRFAASQLELPSAHCTLSVMRSAETKYVGFAADPAVLPPLLFDVAEDPSCLVDRSGDPSYALRRAEAAEELGRWRQRHDDATLANHLLTAEGVVVHRDAWR